VLLIATCVERLTLRNHRKKVLTTTVLIALACSTLPTSYLYLKASGPGYKEGLNQVTAISTTVLESISDAKIRAAKSGNSFIVTDDNPVTLKIVAYLSQGVKIDFGEYTDLFSNFGMPTRLKTGTQFGPHFVKFPVPPNFSKNALPLRLPSRSVINGEFRKEVSQAVEDSVSPRLVFVPSSIGEWWSTPGKRFESAFSIPEPDPHIDGGVMQAFGRFALFRVENASGPISLDLSVSSSFLPQHDFRLGDVVIYGSEMIRVRTMGEGSANLVTPEFNPKQHAGVSYFLIDFGISPKTFPPYSPSFLSRLYGQEIERDPRQVTIFVRNLSLHSSSRTCSDSPTLLKVRLGALAGCYSGMFEDGWMSSHVELYPRAELVGKRVKITGYLNETPEVDAPTIDFNGKPIRVFVTGQDKIQFEVSVPEGPINFDLSRLKPDGTLTQKRLLFVTGVSVVG